jgi:hypothetical protein
MLDPHPKRVNVGCAGDDLLAVVAIILVLDEPSMPTHHLVTFQQITSGVSPK